MSSTWPRAGVIIAALVATVTLAPSGAAAVQGSQGATTVPYLCRTIVEGSWTPINGHTRDYDSAARSTARPGQLFRVTVDPASATTNPDYIKTVKDIVVAFALPDNAELTGYKLFGWSGLGDTVPRVDVVGDQFVVTAPGPIPGGTRYDMPSVTFTLRAPDSGVVTSAPGGLSFTRPGFGFSRQMVGEQEWGPVQCYPDPEQPVTFTTTVVG